MSDTQETTRAVILRYFNAWQEPADLDDMRACLDDAVISDLGFTQINGAEQRVGMIGQTGTPWKKVTLLESIFSDNAGALVYEGVAVVDEKKTRVGEHVTVKNGRITGITASICALG